MYRTLRLLLTGSFLLLVYSLSAQSWGAPHLFIGERSYAFRDTGRNRPVITEVWYPTPDSLRASDSLFSPFHRSATVRDGRLPSDRRPLILLSHGTGGGRLTLEWLAQSLVRKGFLVAAVDHYGNTYNNRIALEFLKPWERPLDISFALTSLLQDSAFRQAVDTERIGVTGFSLGGYTVIALAGGVIDYARLVNYFKTIGHRELEVPEFPGLARYLDDPVLLAGMRQVPVLKDRRIRAFFALSPALGGGFTSMEQFRNIDRPIFLVGAQSDSIAPVRSNARHYHQLIHGSRYFEFPGKVGHYVMLPEAGKEVQQSDLIYFRDDPAVDRHWVHLQVDSMVAAFFRSSLK